MDKTSKIYVAGHHSKVAEDIIKKLKQLGFNNIITRERWELDLTSQSQVESFFNNETIEYVFITAARSTGIIDNFNNPVDCFLTNIQIQNNVLSNCYKNNVKKVIFFASASALPDIPDKVLTEDDLLTGEISKQLEPYALAKLCGIKLCQYYNMQSREKKYISILPCYIYGEGKESSIVVTLIKEIHDAKINDTKEVVVWGDENLKYQLLYSEDVADAALLLMLQEKIENDYYIVSNSEIITKKQLVKVMCDVIGFKGTLKFDSSKPTSQSREISNNKIAELGWHPNIELRTGIERVYGWYLKTRDKQKE